MRNGKAQPDMLLKFRFFQSLFGIACWITATAFSWSYIRQHFFDDTYTIVYYIIYFCIFPLLCFWGRSRYKKMKRASADAQD